MDESSLPAATVKSANATEFEQYYQRFDDPALQQGFRNLDDPDVLATGLSALQRNSTINYVADIAEDTAWAAFDLTAASVIRLMSSDRPECLTARWINIFHPDRNKTLLEMIAQHYDFSPRLLAMMSSDPVEARPSLNTALNPQEPRRAGKSSWTNTPLPRDSVVELERGLDELFRQSPGSSRSSLPYGNIYRMADDLWHYTSVDFGRSYICIGYNSLYGTKCAVPLNDSEGSSSPSRCDDSTANIDALHTQIPMSLLPIRMRIGSTIEETVHREADTPGLLFYYLFENWHNSYTLISRRESRYGVELAKLRTDMFQMPRLHHIDRLDRIGRELGLLQRHYHAYNRIIERLLEPQVATAASLQNSRIVSDDASRISTDTVRPLVITERESMLGVSISSAARVRFKRLKDLIDLYALSEVEEYLKQKDALVAMYRPCRHGVYCDRILDRGWRTAGSELHSTDGTRTMERSRRAIGLVTDTNELKMELTGGAVLRRRPKQYRANSSHGVTVCHHREQLTTKVTYRRGSTILIKSHIQHPTRSCEGVVILGLESLVARNNHLALDAASKIVYSRTHDPSKVSVLSGGGSGHEPAWSGYVGDGMLAAAVNGEVFASPSAKQVMAAISHVPSDAGTILCITNYTGDNLHFGLAREKAAGKGNKIAILRMTDDVALGREQTENTGRRGLAANMFVLKLCGAAAEAGYTFEKCMEIGTSVNASAVTVGSSLDHCHIPGREHHRAIPQDAVVLGMGIHNEPGLREVSPIPPVENLVADMLKYCLDPTDKDRAFVEFRAGDVVCLLINNFGGMSNFELEALTTVTRKVLARDWQITPKRIYAQCFETSLNAPGWSISLLNVSRIERETGTTVHTLLHLLNADTNAPAWPRNGYKEAVLPQRKTKEADARTVEGVQYRGPQVDPVILESSLRHACEAAIQAEPNITKWDIEMGDGDCGEAVVGMCQGVLRRLDAGLCKDGRLFDVLDEIEDAVEDIGGTLGAIIAILLASFTVNLRRADQESGGLKFNHQTAGDAAGCALRNLMGYTSAKAGGRTVMDVLIPFCETLEKDCDLSKAVAAAEQGARSTSGMKARFGRGESCPNRFRNQAVVRLTM
nr:dihydroxyacetone kinase 1 [Quercus suber]